MVLCILLNGILAAPLVSASLIISDWSVIRSARSCFSAFLSVSRSSGLGFSVLLLTCLFAVLRVLSFSAYFSLVYQPLFWFLLRPLFLIGLLAGLLDCTSLLTYLSVSHSPGLYFPSSA